MDENTLFERIVEHTDRRFDRLEASIDRAEEKLDSHLERISRTEEAISWLRGHVRIVTAVGVSVLGFLVQWYLTK